MIYVQLMIISAENVLPCVVISVNLVQFVFSQGLDTFKIDHIIPRITYQVISCQVSPVTLNLIRRLICEIENTYGCLEFIL